MVWEVSVAEKLSFDEVNAVLKYEDGALYSKVTKGKKKEGDLVGITDKDGYQQVCIYGRHFVAHRLIWLLKTGAWPVCQIDPINGVRSDNRFENLRECSASQNAMNKKASRQGFKGVTLHKQTGKFQATCSGHGYIGLFQTEEEAAHAYDEICIKNFGEFARPNFPSERGTP
jgi:hypothetical protein